MKVVGLGSYYANVIIEMPLFRLCFPLLNVRLYCFPAWECRFNGNSAQCIAWPLSHKKVQRALFPYVAFEESLEINKRFACINEPLLFNGYASLYFHFMFHVLNSIGRLNLNNVLCVG